MAIGKKSMFFTIVSLILVASIIFYYVTVQRYTSIDRMKVIQTRVLSMDSFISDTDHDIKRGLYITSMRSLIGITEYLAENGSSVTNFTQSFNELMFNGTVNGELINITKDATFGDWIRKIRLIGDKLNINVTFIDLEVIPFQENPWEVNIRVSGNVDFVDKNDLARWHRILNVTTTLDILDFEDPLYTIKSKGKLTNKIIRSNYTSFVIAGNGTNLVNHANNSWYIPSNLSPSFLMRFAGNLSPSSSGIESIVNVDEIQLAAPELFFASRSSVDYIYLGNITVANCILNETKNILPWLRLDDAHLPIYDANCES